MNASFWVYVNEPNDKALGRAGDGSFCDDGRGLATDKLAHKGRWPGPFSQQGAVVGTPRFGKKNKRWCGHCARPLGLRTVELGGGR